MRILSSSINGRVEGSAASATLALLASLMTLQGFFHAFSTFFTLDDQGYMMITAQQFLDGRALYDDVFTHYGPFYYLVRWLLHGLAGVPVSHDAFGLMTVIARVAIALLAAIAVYRVTRSLFLALFVQFGVNQTLWGLVLSPGHPQELAALGLSGALLAAMLLDAPETRGRGAALLGMIGVALILMKVNLGAFFLMALLLAFVAAAKPSLWRNIAFATLAVAAVVCPFALMWFHIAERWAWHHAALFSTSIACVLLVAAQRRASGELTGRQWILCGASASLVLVATAGFMMTRGTSLSGLINGVVWQNLWVPRQYVLAGPVYAAALPCAAAALAGALVFIRQRTASTWWIWSLAQVAFGAYVLVQGQLGRNLYNLNFGMPFLWLLMAGEPRPFRAVWSLLAVFQVLQVYPVFGTQVQIGTFLMIPIAAVCVYDGLTALGRSVNVNPSWLAAAPRVATVAACILVGVLTFTAIGTHLKTYASNAPLQLPGASLSRLRPALVTELQWVSRNLAQGSDSFVALPGLNSFYFWSNKRPPTSLNPTFWVRQLNVDQQRVIMRTVDERPGVRILYSSQLLSRMANTQTVPQTPFMSYIFDRFRSEAANGRYEILARPATTNGR